MCKTRKIKINKLILINLFGYTEKMKKEILWWFSSSWNEKKKNKKKGCRQQAGLLPILQVVTIQCTIS